MFILHQSICLYFGSQSGYSNVLSCVSCSRLESQVSYCHLVLLFIELMVSQAAFLIHCLQLVEYAGTEKSRTNPFFEPLVAICTLIYLLSKQEVPGATKLCYGNSPSTIHSFLSYIQSLLSPHSALQQASIDFYIDKDTCATGFVQHSNMFQLLKSSEVMFFQCFSVK